MTEALFELPDGAFKRDSGPDPVVERLSPDRRRTLRQAAALAAGKHPLGGRLHLEAAPADDRAAPGRRCGNCRFRAPMWAEHAGHFPKCWANDGARATRSAASDCRAWWPACTAHEWVDRRLSPDAARCVP